MAVSNTVLQRLIQQAAAARLKTGAVSTPPTPNRVYQQGLLDTGVDFPTSAVVPPAPAPAPSAGGLINPTPFNPRRVRPTTPELVGPPVPRGGVSVMGRNEFDIPVQPPYRPGFGTAAKAAGLGGAVGLGVAASSEPSSNNDGTGGRWFPGLKLGEEAAAIKSNIAQTQGISEDQLDSEIKAEIVQANPDWEKKDVDWMEGLSKEFDLTALGLHLLANNDGELSIGQALGQALQASRTSRLGRDELARKADIQERETVAMEKRTDAAMITAINSANTMLDAYKTPNATDIAVTQGELQASFPELTLNPDDKPAHKAVIAHVYNVVDQENRTRVSRGEPPLGPNKAAFVRQYVESRTDLFTAGFWGTDVDTVDPSALSSVPMSEEEELELLRKNNPPDVY